MPFSLYCYLPATHDRHTILNELKNRITGNTKQHIDTIKNLPRADIFYLPTDKLIGTFLIFDDRVICFQIDGVELKKSVPSDLITIKVDNPKEELIVTYINRFERLVELSKSFQE